jgi:hypothetical protein
VWLIGVIADGGINGVAKRLRNAETNPTAAMAGATVDTHKWLKNLTDLIGRDAIAIITDHDFAMAGTNA